MLIYSLVRMPTFALTLDLDVARYVFDETSARLLNNLTKSVKDDNKRLRFKMERILQKQA